MNGLAIDHVFLTRFNVPTAGKEGLIRSKNGWLKERVELFEHFCAPAMTAQTIQDFHWLIYFDPASPPWFMKWLKEAQSRYRFTAVFRSSVPREDLLADLAEITGASGDILLTTNLDNDDGLAVDFVQRLQQSIRSSRRSAMYFTHGLILSGTSTYLRIDSCNAFCSVAESWDEPVTAWAEWHNRLGLIMPVKELSGSPAWLQVVHNRNVSNTIHGRLCNPASFRSLFPYALHGMEKPGRRKLFLDNAFIMPARYLKEKLRLIVKTSVIKHFGPGSLDTVKNKVASMNSILSSTFSRPNN